MSYFSGKYVRNFVGVQVVDIDESCNNTNYKREIVDLLETTKMKIKPWIDKDLKQIFSAAKKICFSGVLVNGLTPEYFGHHVDPV